MHICLESPRSSQRCSTNSFCKSTYWQNDSRTLPESVYDSLDMTIIQYIPIMDHVCRLTWKTKSKRVGAILVKLYSIHIYSIYIYIMNTGRRSYKKSPVLCLPQEFLICSQEIWNILGARFESFLGVQVPLQPAQYCNRFLTQTFLIKNVKKLQ